MATKEILTIQLGEFSNVTGALWWNMQGVSAVSAGKSEVVNGEKDESVFYRQSNSAKVGGNPRLLVIDLKGQMDFPSQNQEFKLSPQGVVEWAAGENTAVSCEEILGTSPESFDFENDDFHDWKKLLNNKLHPKSLSTLNGLQHTNPIEKTFNLFSQGMACMEKEDDLEYLENQIRYFIEECDYFQGFNMLFDADNGFGGVASKLLRLIKQEYPNKTTFTIPLLPACSTYENARRAERLINFGFVMESLFDDSCMFSPVSLDPLWSSNNSRKFVQLENFKPTSTYHAGAVVATALDAIFFPLQAKKGSLLSLADLVKRLTSDGRKAVGASCAVPLRNKVSNLESLNSAFAEVTSLTPCIETFENCWTQQLVWRGLPNVSDFQSLVNFWSRIQWERTTTFNSVFDTVSSFVKPFPNLFLDSSELVGNASWRSSNLGPHNRTFGGLHSSVSLGNCLKNLHTELSKIDRRNFQQFLSSGMEQDDLLENRDRIITYSELYQES